MDNNPRKALFASLLICTCSNAPAQAENTGIKKINNVVVIYAENRSFDNLYGLFPGADGLKGLKPEQFRQVDRDGTPLAELPAIWQGLTAEDVKPALTEDQTRHLPNQPFRIDDDKGFNLPATVPTRDLVHRFYQVQMQINGGKNDKFSAWSDGGAAVMGFYDGSKLPMWPYAQKYVLADHFFLGAFGGSFLNHIMLICACVPKYPDAATSPAKAEISAVNGDGFSLRLKADSPTSALQGPPIFENDGALTPDGFAINTMSPPFQPSDVKPASRWHPTLANPYDPSTLPPQTAPHIGDLLTAKGISWAWYGGAWKAALFGKGGEPKPNFQFHHQPFNYFASLAPGTAARAEHLKDGGLEGAEFLKDVDGGKLPAVAFYKPQGNLNEHPGYTDEISGDQHIADVIAHLEKSPQWPNMLIVVTYDENGGFWDHVSPPKADRWGPGNRVPAIIISPFAKMGTVDHTPYDTTSILRFITKRFDLDMLQGLKDRAAALEAAGQPPMGDLTAALKLE